MAHLLNRQDAPFGSQVWDYIDSVVVNAAKSQYSVRRIVEVEGPYGLGTKTVPTRDRATKEKAQFGEATTAVAASRGIPLGYVTSSFFLGSRDIESFEQSGIRFDATAVAEAAIATALQEDRLLLNGSKELDTEGLTNAKGAQSHKLRTWNDVGKAAGDIMAALTTLDEAGFHGPYALALAPALYNQLFRLYPQTHLTEFDHIKEFVTDGVVKAPSLDSGGVLLATGPFFVSIALGQDVMAGFIGPVEGGYELSVTESVALRILVPQAICVLKAG
jgi:uncharacterized linocin/CFP29 family protein